jgi:hypothetical protein
VVAFGQPLADPPLINLLVAQGFSAVLECLAPAQAKPDRSRVTLVATRGDALTPRVTPLPTEPSRP